MPQFLNKLKILKHGLSSLSIKQILAIIFFFSLVVSLPLVFWAVLNQKMQVGKKAAEVQPTTDVRSLEQSYLQAHEPADRQFQRSEIGTRSIYFHQRMVGEAIVEKDFINYQFDKSTGQLSKKFDHWRADVPAVLPTLKLTKQQAESMVTGQVQFSNLYLISPESDIFSPIKPTPQNPCWVVSSLENGYSKLTIIDAVTGQNLGYGISPPANKALAITTFWSEIPCSGGWTDWSNNAANWLSRLGFSTDNVFNFPALDLALLFFRGNPSPKVFYELTHGDSSIFLPYCNSGAPYIGAQTYEALSASNIRQDLANRDPMSFTFIGSCDGMCSTGPGTLSYEFRKGSNQKAVTVGYCGMSKDKCVNCWGYTIPWQDNLFNYMSQGDTIKSAFDKAIADYPACGLPGDCIRFAGDESYRIAEALFTPTPTPTLTPTPTRIPPTPTLTLTPSPTAGYLRCNAECTSNEQCQTANCYSASCHEPPCRFCRNPNCPLSTNCICPSPTPTLSPTLTPTPAPRPNLVMENIYTASSRIYYSFSNSGQAAAQNFSSYLYINNVYKDVAYINFSVAPGSGVTSGFPNYIWANCSGAGDSFKVCLDAPNTIPETNEQDNCLTKLFPCPTSTPTPTPIPFKVFITSQAYNGNLGGLSGADAKCQALASAAGLSGSFKAWLSNSTTNAKDRFNTKNLPYYRTDGIKVADNFTDLTDGTLQNPIIKYESGATMTTPVYAWTGTDRYGVKKTSNQNFCYNWISAYNKAYAYTGRVNSTLYIWTDSVTLYACNTALRFYCFEDR